MGFRGRQLLALLLLIVCSHVAENAVSRVERQTCGKSNFQCQNGECIEQLKVCDGSADCSDKSDENEMICKPKRCPDYSFRCTYGACVNTSARCDGTVQCEGDGSDEAPELCGSPAPKCTLPPKHGNGGYKVLCRDSQACGVEPGEEVPFATKLEFFCNEGYRTSGSSVSYCLDKVFTPPPPVCDEGRCPPLVHESIDVKCYSSAGEKIPCDKPMGIGSIANFQCKSHFAAVKINNKVLICTSNATWDNQPLTCVPECGRATLKGQHYALGEEIPVAITISEQLPWHVGIYLKRDGKFEQICGGTIIKTKLILTAAHCFPNSRNAGDYMVVAGKYHRGFEVKDPSEQQLEVESIEIKGEYQAVVRYYSDDIAIIVLKKEIIISNFVRPVCVDLEKRYGSQQLSSGNIGYVATWDTNESTEPSDLLQTTKLPLVEFKQCYKDFPVSFQAFFTYDKFCAGFINGSAICRGDGGAGLSFEQDVTPELKQWFVQGIMSLATPPRRGKFCPEQRVLFTKVDRHLNWIKTYYNKY